MKNYFEEAIQNFIKTINPPFQNFPDACLARDYSQVMPE